MKVHQDFEMKVHRDEGSAGEGSFITIRMVKRHITVDKMC